MSSPSDSDGGRTDTGVGNNLTTLVPTFDPSKDNLQVFTQKVELVLAAWPKSKITELVMRLILNCQGSAFSKLQLHQAELMENDEKSVRKLIELLGGHWGRIGLERQYEEAEQALFNTVQMRDESNDSFLARSDIAWSKFLAQKISMADLQAFVLLRGSTLSPEEKKKVILESDNSLEGKLTVARVSEAIRILGATFFQEMTGQKSTAKQKVYSASTLVTEHDDEDDQVFQAQDDPGEEEFIEALLSEGDTDAALVSDFEAAANELLQEDSDLASAYSAYTEARPRLTEKFKNRGFWSTNRSSTTQFKGKESFVKGMSKGKGSWNQKPRRSLQDRILNSYCRNCNRKGHWKAECPYKSAGSSMSGTPSGTSTASGSQPTTTVSVEGPDDIMPMEFLHLPTVGEEPIDDTLPVLVSFCEHGVGIRSNYHMTIQGEYHGDNGDHRHAMTSARERLQSWGLRNESREVRNHVNLASPLIKCPGVSRENRSLCSVARSDEHQPNAHAVLRIPRHIEPTIRMSDQPCFASHGSHGILDLGASTTVIGSQNLGELIRSLDSDIRRQLSKCPCNIVFKFGNQSTLTSTEALVVPIGTLKLKVAVVPGGTPFLISNTLMRTLRATIDCATQKLSSAQMSHPISLQLTAKGLFLLDLNELIRATMDKPNHGRSAVNKGCAETFMSEETTENTAPLKPSGVSHAQVDKGVNIDGIGKESASQGCATDRHMSRSCSEPTNSQAIDQARLTVVPTDPVITLPDHVVVAETPSAPDPIDSGASASGPSHPHGTVVRGGDVRTEVQRTHLRRHLAGPRMGPIHDQPLSEESQRSPSKVHEVCDPQSGVPGAESGGDSPHQPGQRITAPTGKGAGDGQNLRRAFGHLFCGRERVGSSFRDVRPSDYGPTGTSSSRRLGGDADSYAESGECSDACHSALGGTDHLRADRCGGPGPVREDWDETALTALQPEAKQLKQLIDQFSQELQHVISNTTPMGKPYELGEIMCSENSPLTHQVLQLGKKAFRFGYAQGDLSQECGRASLFRLMARHQPKHVWYSPTCGPWSAWSQFNSARSMMHQEEYSQKRHDLLYQLALGIVLYRHQVARGNHLHWEQPKRSLMFKSPLLAEVHEHTQACQFDMCRVGQLKDPANGMFMQKGMTVLTTFAPLFQQLHGLCCDHRHDHQQIEGSCRLRNGQIMLRTQFTEIYPRKFARSVAQVLSKSMKCWPYNWKPGMMCFAPTQNVSTAVDAALAVLKTRKKPTFPKSEVISPQARVNAGAKRSKTDPEQSLRPTLEMCQEVIQAICQSLPRVGKTEIMDATVISSLGNIFPDKRIHRIIACRGTDRTIAPPKDMHPMEAPFRKMLMLGRTGEIKHEVHWEKWVDLSKRQLVRPSHSCRVNITVFAKDHPESNSSREPKSEAKGSSLDKFETPLHDALPSPELKRSEEVTSQSSTAPLPNADQISSEPGQSQDSRSEIQQTNPSRLDTSSEGGSNTPPPEASMTRPGCQLVNQGIRFLGLPKWEQQTIQRMHKNLGHPSNDRLAKALQVSGARPEMIQAALELRCATCAATAPPKTARPSSLKPMLDFNHKIYLDGITWTNKMNKTFHFYHMLDAGTNQTIT